MSNDKQQSSSNSLIEAMIALFGGVVTLLVFLIAQRINKRRRERAEIKDILRILNRLVFKNPRDSEDPAKMLHALRGIRIQLQEKGAWLIDNVEAAALFMNIYSVIHAVECTIVARYPAIEMLDPTLEQYRSNPQAYEHARAALETQLGKDYWNAVTKMMAIRKPVDNDIAALQRILK